GVEALLRNERLRVVRKLERDLSLRKPLGEDLRLLLDDLHELRSHEVLEDDDLVDAVQELGPELTAERVHDALAEELLLVGELGDERRPDVARHDDDDVLEVDRATVPIGETPVVEDLQEDVEDVGVRLLDLVEQEHGVRPPPYCFGELSALLEPDVAGRRADEPRYRVRF